MALGSKKGTEMHGLCKGKVTSDRAPGGAVFSANIQVLVKGVAENWDKVVLRIAPCGLGVPESTA